MELIGGQLLEVHPRLSLEKPADLIDFDGPLLSLFEDKDGEPFLFSWADVDAQVNRCVRAKVADSIGEVSPLASSELQ